MRFFGCWLLIVFIFSSCTSSPDRTPENAQAEDYYKRAFVYRYSSPDSLWWCAAQIDSLSEDSPYARALADICYGTYYNQLSKYRLAEKSYSNAVELLTAMGNDTLLATARTGLGNSYKNLARFDDAIEQFLLSLELYEKTGHSKAAGVHVSMAQVYQLKEDEQRAKEHLHIAMNVLSKDKSNPSYLIAAHTLANLHGMAGRIDSALLIDREGLRICDSVGPEKLKTPFLDNLALCMLFTGQLDSSRMYFMQCLQIDSAFGEPKQMADTYINLSGLAMEEKNYTQAEAYAQHALKKSKETGYGVGERQAWTALAVTYAAMQQFDAALAAKDSVNVVSRRITNEKTEARIAELEAVYDSEKKTQQITAQEEYITIQRIAIGAGVFILLLVVIIALLYIATLRRKKEMELTDRTREGELRAQAAVYESEMQERTRIARDLHDSVGQMLSVTKMQLSSRTHDQPELEAALQPVTGLIDKAIAEVRTISRNLLPEEVNFGVMNALESLRDTINTSGVMKMEVQRDAASDFSRLTPAHVLAVYRIAQEVTSNMLRHSQGRNITLSVQMRNGNIHLSIADDGKGVDSRDIETSAGIGWKNIRARVALLNGTMQIHSQPQQGTRVEIVFTA
jgi:signal transduction histidine kinase